MESSPFVFLIIGAGSAVGLFAATLFAAKREGNRRANLVFAALMLLLSLQIAHPLLFPALTFEPFPFLIAPVLSWYFRALLQPDSALRPVQLLHALPFTVVAVLSLVPLPPMDYVRQVLWALLVVQAFAYLLPSLSLVFRYRHSLRDQESNVAGLDLRWLTWSAHLFLALYTGYAVVLLLMLHGSQPDPLRESLSVALSVLVFIAGQRAALQRQPPATEPPLAQRTIVSPAEAAELKRQLLDAMEREKLYLNPDLRLSDLVVRLGATRNQLSYVINEHLGKNFYDFVNEYRVREAERLIRAGTYDDKKMIAIAFDAGFNSKPAFNSVFKKRTGRTPSEYRDQGKNLSPHS